MVNPFTESSASALREPEGPSAETDAATQLDEDSGTPTHFAGDASTVEIAFSPVAGSASLTPTNSAGQSAQVKVLATVSVKDSGGYSVYIKSNSQNLVGQNSSNNIIPGLQGSATYANLPVNTWGYTAVEGTAIPDNAAYKAVSTSGNGDKITENTNSRIDSDTKIIALSFAARVNDQKAADTYKNTTTVSVVSSPKQMIFTDYTVTMQDMTADICSAVSDGAESQLKDTRDGKYYWVAKLADGKCWMTQNLDLDLSTSKTLTAADSDVPAAGYTPAYDTATQATASTILADNTGQRSWSLGNYRLTSPATASDCGSKKNSLANCTSQFTAYTTPTTANQDAKAHYVVGNHYQWNAATAGTGGTITNGQASNSICPKGWKLPESNAEAAGTFKGLIDAYSIGSDIAKLTSSPLYFVRGGYVRQDANVLFADAGNYGYYWSATSDSNGIYAYYLHFSGTSGISPSGSYNRQNGFSVRCIAR
jgi:uncharacterized protein (TIGR02145 family)